MFCKMNRILVTGGVGFLGSNLCRRLIKEQNNYVIALDNLYTGSIENIEDILKCSNFEFIEADVTEPIDIPVNQIYNAACPASPPAYQERPTFTTRTCVIGTLNMLELARKYNATLLQFSTSEVYGDALIHPQVESYWGNVNPDGIRACYDEGKRCAETLCFDYNREFGTCIRVVRIFNTYGPYMDPNDGRVISNFILQALKDQDITVYGEGKQTRSFCYVDDLVEGLIAMMNNKLNFMGPVNLGNPGEFTMIELAHKVIEMINSNSKLKFCPLPSDDPKQRKPDISLAKQMLGWSPKVNLNDGLEKTIGYYAALLGRKVAK